MLKLMLQTPYLNTRKDAVSLRPSRPPVLAVPEVRVLQGAPDLLVRVSAARVHVVAQAAHEDGGVLRDDGHARAQLLEAEAGNVDAVDRDAAGGRLLENGAQVFKDACSTKEVE